MPKVYIEDMGNHLEETVEIQGWVTNKRSSGKVKFLMIRDGTGTVQSVLVKGETPEKVLTLFSSLTQESSIRAEGKVSEHRGNYELQLTDLSLVHASENYPITPKEHGIDFLLDRRHLWLRSSRQQAIMRIRSELIYACHQFFHENGFTHLDMPIFTPAACEGTSTLFEVDYFDEKVFLTQSGQLYSEAAAMAFGKVYCFGPTFRAEKSKTRRHLTEFWMVEPEVAFCDIQQNMDLAEAFVEYIVQHVVKTRKKELESLERPVDLLKNVKRPFPRLSYDEAVIALKKEGIDFQWGNDFGGADETVLAKRFDKPFFIHRFPASCKAFYMKLSDRNPKLSLSMDMLAPEGYGEIIGGGQREENIDVLLKQLNKHGLDQKNFEWYLDLRRFGSVPHSGFGMGIERTLTWICGLKHVREAIPFPRMMYRMKP